ncbi:MAG: VOC family protein [Myxococcota bacterium]
MKAVIERVVSSVPDALRFYRDELGFSVEVREDGAHGQPEWARLELSGLRLSLKDAATFRAELPAFAETPLGGTTMLCLEVADLAAWRARLGDRVRIIDPVHRTPCGSQQFAFLDPDGYPIVIEQPSGTGG